MTTAPAGWYADAQRDGHERWFDGSGWTDERRLASSSQTDSPTGRKRHGWVPAATAFVVLLVVLCGGALVLAGAALDTVSSVVSSQ